MKNTSILWGGLLGVVLFAQSQIAQAQQRPTANSNATSEQKTTPPNVTNDSSTNSDKLDVEGLEKKYWSAKDDEFTVVQNRAFTKNRKIYISVMTGKMVNDGFVEGAPNSFSLGYFFNEKNGINIDSTNYTTKDNSVTKSFFEKSGTKPSYNTLLSTTSLRYFWSPIYAKVSLLEKKILYLDLALGVHVGQTSYKVNTYSGGQTEKTSHYGFDISQLWFLSQSLALRFDVRNSWSSQKQYTYYDSGGGKTTSLGNTRFQDNAWLLGINYFFGN